MKSGAAMHPIAAIPAAASHLEMVQIAPRLQTLDILLEVRVYLHTRSICTFQVMMLLLV